MKSKIKNLFGSVTKKSLFFTFSIISVLLLMTSMNKNLSAFAEDRYSDLQNFTKVLNLVQQYYVEEVDTKKLVNGAIKGLMSVLDPHSSYMSAEFYKDFESETSGEFGGIGIEISIQNNLLTIIAPIEDAPAWNAGVKAGDRIIAINGHSTKGLSLVECSQLMKGKKGSVVTLSIIRGNSDQPSDFAIRRGQVKLKSVKFTNLEEGYLYIKLTSFIDNTFKDLESVLIEQSKKSELKGLLIDLRRNPGGLFDQAIKISDLFLDEGIIVSTIGRNKQDKEVVQATKKEVGFPTVPIVVLINEFSASASEILAGALQDNNRALVVGEKSFGKGSVQSVIKLGDGSGLKLTVARYYTPSGKSIQAEGITPDIEIQNIDFQALNKAIVSSENFREKDMEGHLINEKEKINNSGNSSSKISTGEESKDSFGSTWWNEISKKQDDKLSPRDKLLKSDFQAFQAFNYLRTWKVIKKIKN